MPVNYRSTDYQGGMAGIGQTLASIPGKILEARSMQQGIEASKQSVEASKVDVEKERTMLRELDESIKYNKNINADAYRSAVKDVTATFGEDAAKTLTAPGGLEPSKYIAKLGQDLNKLMKQNGYTDETKIRDFMYSATGQAETAQPFIESQRVSNQEQQRQGLLGGGQSNLTGPTKEAEPGLNDLSNLLSGGDSPASATPTSAASAPSSNLAGGLESSLDPDFFDGLPANIATQIKDELRLSADPGAALTSAMKAKTSFMAAERKLKEEKMKADEAAKRASDLQKQQDDAAMERVRENNKADAASAATTAQNAYTQRTYAMKQPQIDAVTAFDNGLVQLETVSNLMDKKFVGQIDGRVGSVKQKFGMLGDQEAMFRSAIATFENELLKLRSGAAVTESEYERFRKEVANTNVPVDQFVATLKANVTALKNKKSVYLTNLKKAGVDIAGFENDLTPVNTNPGSADASSVIPKVTGASDYNSIPSGSQYYDPNGNLRTKP